MTDAREQILGNLRRSLKRTTSEGPETEAARTRLAEHRPNLIPARAASLDPEGRIALFIEMAREVAATVDRIAGMDAVPGAVADYLAQHNLPSELVATPDPALEAIPWHERPTLAIRKGIVEPSDGVGITACFAGIAETGTLMLLSGPESPTRNNFLPDTHIVVLRADQVIPTYEEGWMRLRTMKTLQTGHFTMPRTVNFITGPSRTADIELKIELGAHGPRRLHILVVDDEPAPA